MRDIAVSLVVFGLLPYILFRPHWGIYLSAWLGYMNPHRLCYGFALSLPFVQFAALATLLGLVFSREKKRMIWSGEVVLLIIFILWMGVTTLLAFFPDPALEQYIKVIKIQILTFLAIFLLTSRDKLHTFIWVIALSLGYYGLKGGIFTIIEGGQHRVWGPEGTFIGGNNELALALLMTIPLFRYLQLQETRKWVQRGLLAAMLLTAFAAIGSQSRGAMLGMAVMGFSFWLKSRYKLGSAILVIVGAVGILSVMPETWYARMDTVKTYEEDRSAMSRINAWRTAFNIGTDRVTGGGFETFQASVYAQYSPDPTMVFNAHSIYFQVLGEHGFIGLAMFLGLMAMTWFKCSSVIRRTKQDSELKWAQDLAAMLQVSLLGYASAGAFLGLAYFDYFYHLVAIAVVLADLVTQRIASPDAVRADASATNPYRLAAPAKGKANASRPV